MAVFPRLSLDCVDCPWRMKPAARYELQTTCTLVRLNRERECVVHSVTIVVFIAVRYPCACIKALVLLV
jgi:hypothetical protein